MNNFFLNQDPLLFKQPYSSPYDVESDPQLRQQLNDALIQYRTLQNQTQQPPVKDYIGELDSLLKNISESAAMALNEDVEYKNLSAELQNLIQREIMSSVKWKINSNAAAVKNIQRQSEIIEQANKRVEAEERKNLSELNDYVKNYSNITFDEYKKIKNGVNENK